MESRYFKRDISWLSFNYRVLLEAEDDTLPLYERINFISIYSSNLEEFYKIRVADHKAIATGAAHSDEESVQSAMQLVTEINEEVNRQLEERIRIYEQKILPALRQHHIIFYQSRNVEPFHKEFLRRFFREEIFPYLSPVPVSKDKVISFLRDNRLYLAVRLHSKGTLPGDPDHTQYFVMKLPYSKVPRFIELPKQDKNYYLMFIEDIIKANIDTIFPGYDVDSSYCIKISRDADILIDESANTSEIIEQVKTKVKKRKIGAVCRFVYDRAMPDDFLDFLVDAFRINRQELVPGDKHLNMEDLRHLPNPNNAVRPIRKPQPMKLACLDERESIFRYVEKKDLLLHYPYHSFEHFIHFLYEAVHEPTVREIMVTQYRVAENSAVINTLIAAAQNGKKVTVFVELKARFDEENNLATAEMMKAAGINILFSLPGLKVHAKVALVLRRDKQGHKLPSYAYISTGNFNEKTATLYADCGLFTCNPVLVNDLHNLFRTFQGKENPVFHRLLVARFNLMPELNRLIDHEIELAKSGKQGRIILKMNALQDPAMIERLYEASQAGVKIDLIVRGICCLIPGRKYSRNIRVTRIVDTFLEHARVWYFGNGGKPKLFLGSPDWMRRNLYRRIEAVTPILDPDLKRELSDMLSIQLSDKRKACFVDDHLRNRWKSARPQKEKIRSQYTFYEYLKG
ncbi:RNA degradosome polyphosphate kinase [Bacteroides eggerthii]|jgi:polyphosphate kinase|uniref:RNA degradosome polyphosphate kinase n=1 Tax=Bacteroides eggerthii TaxID=28111 RepID=UPI00110702E7|nr:RNA degradosome polyphosphate kinase [Bacteroides eggerthii]MBV3843894.1 RNA degradosome polyphosphate kinase [Bacteroides eggerthii]MBV3846814.1 RNA degradosome polyphosphate kinase [Bacteroides eggerthii]MBV3884990.1 RNA degradosome polyphosphate kinase [Bacteroides eggerthii]MBV3891937.1 RNA degradosome polyphosphate kinase [Bacteroides eggerthii]MBV3903099.1 RNA degradosome polyphosphate kinase [Bacteroides eggerthii]